MKKNIFEGHFNAKSFFNGVDLGKDFNSSEVEFTVGSFRAYGPEGFVQIDYGRELQEGVNNVSVGVGHPGFMTFLGNPVDGKLEVTVNNLQDHQTAKFFGYYHDPIGRNIKLEGDFEGTYK
ncbi:hypothetical protein [Pseudomonas fluorescens]|uniref:hypothetical protein n=1 Tax=Pseudomonas TaxID=286 RepID=UPI002B1D9DB3|nr:hypothetical protein [Pseudomonas fluorescens]